MSSTQRVLSFLPGYMWDGEVLVSTGAAIKPTRFIRDETAYWYCRPVFDTGMAIGLFIREPGIIDYCSKN
jgi:hypothetical protein